MKTIVKKGIAYVLSFAMITALTLDMSAGDAQAAKKYVKSLTVSNSVTVEAGKTKTVTAKIKTVKKASTKIKAKTNNKKIATVKVKGKKIKITGKKAGKAVITVSTVAKGKKGKVLSKKIKVTVKAATVPATPAPTVQPTNSPVIPAQTPAVPVQKKYNVKTVGAINTKEGTISITFDEKVEASALNGTTVTITDGTVKVTATFKAVSDDGQSAVYAFSAEDLAKIQTGNYTVQSDSMNISKEVANTSARVDVTGSSVKGLVYYKDYFGDVYSIENASITVNGESVRSDKKGFYQKAMPADNYNMTVKANGFFDETKEDIKVSTNKASAYNFGMELYDVEKVYLYGTITEDDDSLTVISDAIVSLYEITAGGESLMAVTTTDSNGKFVFANANADYSDFGVKTSSVVRFSKYWGMQKEHKYRVEITKGLSKDNLFDVYEPYTSGQFDLGSSRGVDVGTKLTKVKPITEMTMQLSWDTDLSLKGKVELTLLDTDGRTLLKKKDMTIDKEYFESTTVLNQMKSGAYKLIAEKFFSDSTNVKPTLPAGTYYLVVKTKDADGNYIDSTVVCPVEVTPGERADAQAAMVKDEITRDIKYTTTFSDEKGYGDVAVKNQGNVLNVVRDNEGMVSSTPVAFNSNIYQVVDGVHVLINSISANTFSKNDEVFINTYKQTNLAKDTTYYVETEKTHIVNGDSEFKTDNQSSWNVEFTAAANVTNVTFKDAECFIDNLNTANDNTAALNESIYVNSVTIKVVPANANAQTVTKTIPVEKAYTVNQLTNSGIAINDVEAMGLPVGKYTVDFDFANYKLDAEYEDQEERVIDLQNAKLTCNAKYEKVYPTTISGVVAYADTTKNMPKNGIAVLYTSDFKQIVAAADFEKVDDQVVYSLVDGENGTFTGGTYKLLIRGEGFDYMVKDVTVETNEVKKNVDFNDLTVGSNTNMEPMIKTNSGTGLDSSAIAYAYDEYYINPWDDAVSPLAFECLLTSDYNGYFTLDRVAGSDVSWICENMSKGKYQIVVDSDVTDQKVFDVTLKSTYEELLTVNYTTYDNLIRINLVLSNKGKDTVAFEKGQLDYVTAVSTDGTVSYEGYVLRDSAEDDAGYFYVPAGKEYTITVYSDKNYVESKQQAAQSKESESVYVVCQAIE